jgi:3-mercaptopyruvate sulfurtransferase SseA
MNTVYLCGHIDGTDCGSGQRAINDFVTDSEEVAKKHVEKYKGSWSQSGFYTAIPFRSSLPNAR